MKYRYALIVSQYYHSYNFFTVELENYAEKEYKTNLLSFVVELLRKKNKNWDGYLGDVRDLADIELRLRHNINDWNGDIYIFHTNFLDEIVEKVEYYTTRQIELSKGRKKKEVEELIRANHTDYGLYQIYKKHFLKEKN